MNSFTRRWKLKLAYIRAFKTKTWKKWKKL